MRNVLVLLLLCSSLVLSGATYYIDPSGSDSNNGSSSSPWKTLVYAASKATASGDIIHVNAGTYNETAQIDLAIGVSIEGSSSATCIINAVGITGNLNYLIRLNSGTQNTPGNQHISGISVTGNGSTSYGAISVVQRGNVIIHDCKFYDFDDEGVSFIGKGDGGEPSSYATGNQFYNNTTYGSFYIGGFRWSGQQGILIHHNTMSRIGGSNVNGCVAKFSMDGWNKGAKIYNNSFTRDFVSPQTFDFAVELTHEQGLEFYNNIIEGSLDINFITKGSYDYGMWCHDNTFGPTSAVGVMSTQGLILEFNIEDVVIEKNTFKNLACPVQFVTRAGYNLSNFNFRYNLCYNIGRTGTSGGRGIRIMSDDTPASSSNGYYIYNNIFAASTASGTTSPWGISIPALTNGSTNNIIRNNIITGFNQGAITANDASYISGLTISNNILYGNGNSNDPLYVGTPSGLNYTIPTGGKSDPLFISSSNFHLQANSPAIGAGFNVGLTNDYEGKTCNNPPSIGSFEYSSTVQPPTVPLYQSSSIENATPSLLSMTYNPSLANIVPVVSSFIVLVNSVTRSVSSVVVSGTTVQLNLSSPVFYGDVITVSYTKPSTNPLQTTSGGQAITISAQAVTNNVSATNPLYVSSAIANSTPSLLEMTYNLILNNVAPAPSAFTVTVNSTARTVSLVAVSGTKVQLTLATPVIYGDIVTVSYTKPATNPIQTSAGGQAISITAQTVTNSVAGSTPGYTSSSVENASPSVINMTFNNTLANIVPAASSFSVLVNSVVRTINTVTISGTKVQLSLSKQVVYGDIITVSYTKPASNPLQTSTGSTLNSIVNQPVSNNCVNIAPVSVLASPVSNSSFSSPATISLTANATDADGSVSLVEFYSGNTKIGSVTAAPYTFTWNNVVAGSYSLTAVVTDNQKAKTVSPAVKISVTDKKPSNRHPIIHISNPRKGVSISNLSTVTIDADASDPDGTISRVEFYNGSEKLVELTTAPYTYTWKDVVPGSYKITAIATDNLNDTTKSSPVEFVVAANAKYDAKSDIVKLYPNPNNGQFTIEFVNPLKSDNCQIVITDLAGKQVYNGPVQKEDISKQFDLSGSRSGVYVMLIKDKDILVTKKFIKN